MVLRLMKAVTLVVNQNVYKQTPVENRLPAVN
jgi:hypothetical protein